MTENNKQHCATIAIIGAPNVGKSTLLNQILKTKVSIVSPKVQTTRASMRGILTKDNTQIVFIDTPGIFTNPKRSLEKAIVGAAWRGVEEADEITLLIDATRPNAKETEFVLKALAEKQKKAVVVLNKIDRVQKEKLLPILDGLQHNPVIEEIFLLSALKGDGVEDYKNHLLKQAPEGPWMFPEDQISDAPMRFLAAEITREKCFYQCQQELPYSLMVETEQWVEDDKAINIHQAIYVLKDSQKGILIGNKGSMIKKIGQSSREELTKILEKKVNLFLFVKVREKWIDKQQMYPLMGLDSPK